MHPSHLDVSGDAGGLWLEQRTLALIIFHCQLVVRTVHAAGLTPLNWPGDSPCRKRSLRAARQLQR